MAVCRVSMHRYNSGKGYGRMQINGSSSIYEYYAELARQRRETGAASTESADTAGFAVEMAQRNPQQAEAAAAIGAEQEAVQPPLPTSFAVETGTGVGDLIKALEAGGETAGTAQDGIGGDRFFAELARAGARNADGGATGESGQSRLAAYMQGLIQSTYNRV